MPQRFFQRLLASAGQTLPQGALLERRQGPAVAHPFRDALSPALMASTGTLGSVAIPHLSG